MKTRDNDRHIAVIVAAGSGKRMKAEVPKILLDLCGEPVLVHTVRAFAECPWIDGIVVVAAEAYVVRIAQLLSVKIPEKPLIVTAGGRERADSVYAGLKAVQELLEGDQKGAEYVYIHDGARPFVTQSVLERVRDGVRQHGACLCGVPVKDTIREIGTEAPTAAGGSGASAAETEVLDGAPDRSALRQIQTPQAFDYDLVLNAYELYMHREDEDAGGYEAGTREFVPTDDAGIGEKRTGHRVYLTAGSYRNIKLTTPEDMVIARALIDHDEE